MAILGVCVGRRSGDVEGDVVDLDGAAIVEGGALVACSLTLKLARGEMGGCEGGAWEDGGGGQVWTYSYRRRW